LEESLLEEAAEVLGTALQSFFVERLTGVLEEDSQTQVTRKELVV
jgi:hypothetical protein